MTHAAKRRLLRQASVRAGRRSLARRVRWITFEEADRLRSELRPASGAALVTFMLFTGCRIGEALALDWRDVDFVPRARLVSRHEERGDRRGTLLHPRAVAALAELPH